MPSMPEAGPVMSDGTLADRPAQQTAAAWPLMSHLELGALPTCVGSARKHARAVTQEFGLSALADSVELVVSEIVTNAVRAATSLLDDNLAIPVIHLWLASDLECALIRVWDSSDQPPILKYAGPDDDSGRGLMLVNSVASEWGTYKCTNGKVVWAIIG